MNDSPSPAGPPPEPESPDMNEESATRDSVEVQPPEPEAGQNLPATTGPTRPGLIARVFGGRTRRDQQLQTLQSGYVEMLDMMRSISRHLDRQADAQDQLLKTLDHFPDAVDGLRNVGKATEQQLAVMGMVREQLEANARHEQDIVKSMDGFNKTLNLMDETTRNTTATIGDLVENSRDAEDELRAMLERSEKRLTILTAVLGAFGILTIGVAIVLGLAQRGPAPTTETQPTSAAPATEVQPAASTPAAQLATAEDLYQAPPESAAPAESAAEEPATTPAETAAAAPMETDSIEAAVTDSATTAVLDAVKPMIKDLTIPAASTAETEELAATPPMDEATEATMSTTEAPATAEETPAVTEEVVAEPVTDASAEPAGVKNVVRRFFSFLGDEDAVEAPPAAEPLPEGAKAP